MVSTLREHRGSLLIPLLTFLVCAFGGGLWWALTRSESYDRQREFQATLVLTRVVGAEVVHKERTGRYGGFQDLLAIDRELAVMPDKLGYELVVWLDPAATDWIAMIIPKRGSSQPKCFLRRTEARSFESTDIEAIRASLPGTGMILSEGNFHKDVHPTWRKY
jgi:hypothetical protein